MDGLDSWEAARIAVVGDLHANAAVTAAVLAAAAEDGCDTVVSVGDLTVAWPGEGRRYLGLLDRQLEAHGLRCVFVDGNHEDWPLLAELRRRGEGRRTHPFSERVVWADRGARWEWSGVRFGALGGAYSIDAHRRRDGLDWWPELEQPTAGEVAALAAGGGLDVLVCHDAPAEVPLVSRWPEGSTAEVASRAARHLVSDAVAHTDAAVVFHGHWHHRHNTRVRIAAAAVDVHGLGADSGELGDLWVAVDVAALAPRALAAAGREELVPRANH